VSFLSAAAWSGALQQFLRNPEMGRAMALRLSPCGRSSHPGQREHRRRGILVETASHLLASPVRGGIFSPFSPRRGLEATAIGL